MGGTGGADQDMSAGRDAGAGYLGQRRLFQQRGEGLGFGDAVEAAEFGAVIGH
jgi:hypothetical protein